MEIRKSQQLGDQEIDPTFNHPDKIWLLQIGRLCTIYRGWLDMDPGKHLEPIVKWMACENLNRVVTRSQGKEGGYILFEQTWNFCKNWSHIRQRRKPQWIPKSQYHTKSLLLPCFGQIIYRLKNPLTVLSRKGFSWFTHHLLEKLNTEILGWICRKSSPNLSPTELPRGLPTLPHQEEQGQDIFCWGMKSLSAVLASEPHNVPISSLAKMDAFALLSPPCPSQTKTFCEFIWSGWSKSHREPWFQGCARYHLLLLSSKSTLHHQLSDTCLDSGFLFCS